MIFNNRIFYDANKANEMTKEVREEREIKALEEIYDKIDSYVKAGEFETYFCSLTEFQKNWLIEHGFKVIEISETGSWRDGMFKISWK